MPRRLRLNLVVRLAVACTAMAVGVAVAAGPEKAGEGPKLDPKIRRVQAPGGQPSSPSTSTDPSRALPPDQPTPPQGTAPTAGELGAPPTGPSAPSAVQADAPAGSGPAASAISSGNIATQPNADLGAILESGSGGGVEIQRRNAVVADPRIRGYHVGQVVTFGDGALFVPARLDMDSALSKYDAGSIRDIVIIKGPYSVRYGPGFAFLDIITFDTPRAKDGCDYEIHGRTTLGYQTNGQRWDGLQSIDYGAQDWGFRLTYNLQAGNDYYDGDGVRVPASYNSQNLNFAVGVDLDKNNRVEFKAIRLHQHDLEFPGTYFDINRLNTSAYALKFTSKDNCYYDLWNVDTWYNYTVVDGDTDASYKYNQLRRFLPGPGGFGVVPTRAQTNPNPLLFFASSGPNPVTGLTDFLPFLDDVSKTRIAENSVGIRSAMTWGKKECLNLTAGFDFAYVAQGLQEYIRINDPTGSVPTVPFGNYVPGRSQLLFQNLTLPNSFSYNPGVFIDTTLPIGERLSVRAGARADIVHTTTGDRTINGNIDILNNVATVGDVDRQSVDPAVFSTEPNNPDTTRDFGLVAGFISSDYKFDDHLTGLVGFGYSQRPPTLYELYSSGPFVAVLQPGFTRLIGEPRLAAEKLMQFDSGFKADYGWFKGSVNAFYAWINDYITYDLNSNFPTPGITQNIYTNTDRATLAGGEIYGQVDATCWLTPFAGLSYVQGRDLTHRDDSRPSNVQSTRRFGTETEPLPGIPPLEGRAGFRVHESVEQDKAPKWSVEVACRMVRDQNLFAASLAEQSTPGFSVWDIRGYWKLNDHVLVTAGVENFNNRLYTEHLDLRPGNVKIYRPGTNAFFATQFTY